MACLEDILADNLEVAPVDSLEDNQEEASLLEEDILVDN
jgi:hypothetical protein